MRCCQYETWVNQQAATESASEVEHPDSEDLLFTQSEIGRGATSKIHQAINAKIATYVPRGGGDGRRRRLRDGFRWGGGVGSRGGRGRGPGVWQVDAWLGLSPLSSPEFKAAGRAGHQRRECEDERMESAGHGLEIVQSPFRFFFE
jgi:hypothetical protein